MDAPIDELDPAGPTGAPLLPPPLPLPLPAPALMATLPSPVQAPMPPAPPRPIPHPCQITFMGMDGSEPPRAEVRAWLDKLGPLTAPMKAGLVVIEAIDQGRKDRLYRVRMELTLPDGIVVVGPDHPSNGVHEDVIVAIRNAFRAARRQLELHAQSARVEPAVIPVSTVG